jgi:hypothetical protein
MLGAAWQLYGHSHGKLPAAEGSRSMDPSEAAGPIDRFQHLLTAEHRANGASPQLREFAARLCGGAHAIRGRSSQRCLVVGPPAAPLADVLDDESHALVVGRIQP